MAKRPNYEPKEVTVRRIMKRMAEGTWVNNVSEFRFAEVRGLEVETIRDYVREARNRVTAGIELDEDLRATIIDQLQTNTALMQWIYSKARQDPDKYDTAIAAVRTKNQSLGIMCGLTKRKLGLMAPTEEEEDLTNKSERELLEIIAKSAKEKE